MQWWRTLGRGAFKVRLKPSKADTCKIPNEAVPLDEPNAPDSLNASNPSPALACGSRAVIESLTRRYGGNPYALIGSHYALGFFNIDEAIEQAMERLRGGRRIQSLILIAPSAPSELMQENLAHLSTQGVMIESHLFAPLNDLQRDLAPLTLLETYAQYGIAYLYKTTPRSVIDSIN